MGQNLAHNVAGDQDVILYGAGLDEDVGDGDLHGHVGLGPSNNVHVGLLLHFVIALGNKVLGQIDGPPASQVQVRIQPGRGDDVQRWSPPEIFLCVRNIFVRQPDMICLSICCHVVSIFTLLHFGWNCTCTNILQQPKNTRDHFAECKKGLYSWKRVGQVDTECQAG